MDRAELTRVLMATFLDELAEHVEALNRNALALERDPTSDRRRKLVDELFRSAHSLKGAARSVGVSPIETACHDLESALAAVRNGETDVTPDLLEDVLALADGLGRAAEGLRGGARPDAPAVALALAPPRHPAPEEDLGPDTPQVPSAAGLRLDPEKIDRLVARCNELRIALGRRDDVVAGLETLHGDLLRAREDAGGKGSAALLDGAARSAVELARRAARDTRTLSALADGVCDAAGLLRMTPFATACQGLARLVRDLAQASGKEVELVVEGGDFELDRTVLDALRNPIMHLVRNAVDHGIETPAAREAAGKAPTGVVRVTAALRGSQAEVVVSDDGAGIDLAAVRAQAERVGVEVPDTEAEAIDLLFTPGFSTAAVVTELSGRGVGLDVVKQGVSALHGVVDIRIPPGEGTRFVIVVPLTVGTMRALLVQAGAETVAVPGAAVRGLLRFAPGDVSLLDGREVVRSGGELLRLVHLADALGADGSTRTTTHEELTSAIVVGTGERRAAFAVEALLTEEEIAVKSPGPRLTGLDCFAAVTVLADGHAVLIADADGLVGKAFSSVPGRTTAHGAEAVAPPEHRRILVVEDSVTTRNLYRAVFENAGYDVTLAVDGADGLAKLQERGADVVVADVDMPRLNGFALTQAIRASESHRDLPVILVTALDTDADRARGIEVGADAYLTKSNYDQGETLETIARLL